MKLTGVFAIAAVSLDVTAAICLAPDPDDNRICIPCENPSEGSSATCNVSARHLPCQSSIATCCAKNGISDQAYCLQNSDDGTETRPKCRDATSRGNGLDNQRCQELCQTWRDQGSSPHQATVDDFNRYCYTQKGRGDCFGGWIYGYEVASHGAIGGTFLDTESAALCQLECQRNKDCAGFYWNRTSRKCGLKSLQMMTKAASQSVALDAEIDTQYCNYQQNYVCHYSGFTCAECGGVPRCIWESWSVTSGPKYCSPDLDICLPDSGATTTVAPTTTKPTTTKPTTTTTKPTTTTTKPTTTTTKPTTTTTKPTTTTTKPTTTTTKPTTTTATTTTPTTTTTTPTTTTTTPTTTTTATTTTATTTKPTTQGFNTLPGDATPPSLPSTKPPTVEPTTPSPAPVKPTHKPPPSTMTSTEPGTTTTAEEGGNNAVVIGAAAAGAAAVGAMGAGAYSRYGGNAADVDAEFMEGAQDEAGGGDIDREQQQVATDDHFAGAMDF